ncbi:MAG: AAA family ATPase, partial [Verrucomicrobiota bacterium]
MKLKSVLIRKYKCFSEEQSFAVDPQVTVLVGKNESGKTSVLQALAKSNYFADDSDFKFEPIVDYPRREKKAYDRSGQVGTPIDCVFIIEPELLEAIADDVGKDVFTNSTLKVSRKYDGTRTFNNVTVDRPAFVKHVMARAGINDHDLEKDLGVVTSEASLNTLVQSLADPTKKKMVEGLAKYYEKEWDNWSCPLCEYVARVWLSPRLPAFIYYSDYYELPSRIDLRELQSGSGENTEAKKTAKALFELADIKLDKLVDATDFEMYIAELEATANEITNQLFQYWTTNKDLRIRFQIDKQMRHNTLYPILDIRVEDLKHSVSLPLRSRSKGFNWFFSFVVWFSKIQEKRDRQYILLLDEPGLNLHASAQSDFLAFIEELSKKYQILFTTHSPFMIDTAHLHRVRTVVDREKGASIADGIQERDPDTLFPLQAALGYDIAQNLFIGKANLLVEGAADLVFVTVMSAILEKAGRERLADSIVIVPVGGADKVATFISLLKGNKLKIACLLDTMTDPAAKQRLEDMVRQKIVKESAIRYCDEFVSPSRPADVEDFFTKEDYLKLFIAAFPERKGLSVTKLDASIPQTTQQLARAIGRERYNHYRPA